MQPSLSPCDVEKLKRCLEEHAGDTDQCSHLISAFKSSCGKQEKQEQKTKEEPASAATTTEQAVAAATPTTPPTEK